MTEFKPANLSTRTVVKPPLETRLEPGQQAPFQAEPERQPAPASNNHEGTATRKNNLHHASSAHTSSLEGAGEERRKQRRMRVLQRALIVFNNRQTTIECTVRNISDGGCRLKLGAPIALPERFIVHFCKTRNERLAELAWRTDMELGVRFID